MFPVQSLTLATRLCVRAVVVGDARKADLFKAQAVRAAGFDAGVGHGVSRPQVTFQYFPFLSATNVVVSSWCLQISV